MARENRFQTELENPAKYFFQWKSDHQKFAYYDKVKEQNVFVDFPFKFLAIAPYKTVTGYNSKKGGIYANEVKSINDKLKVLYFKDKELIAEGQWNSIKSDVDNANGKYCESVYVMLKNGEVANIKISGASLSTWFEFQKNQRSRFFNDWVVVNSYKEGKQGSVNYSFPVFEWGTSLNDQEQKYADVADAKIGKYEDAYFGKQIEEEVKETYRENSEASKYDQGTQQSQQQKEVFEPASNLNTEDHDDLPF